MRGYMKYRLKKDELIMETDYAVMADRKMAQGWELVAPFEEEKKEPVLELKKNKSKKVKENG